MVLFSGYFVKYALIVKELPFKNIFKLELLKFLHRIL